jgi:hypothetical protein
MPIDDSVTVTCVFARVVEAPEHVQNNSRDSKNVSGREILNDQVDVAFGTGRI